MTQRFSMTTDSPAISEQSSQPAIPPPRPDAPAPRPPEGHAISTLRAALISIAGLLCVVLIGLLDYLTGPHLSCSIFYLIPVAACAWWGGFPQGILIAVAGSVAWHLIEVIENPTIPLFASVWNGAVRFCTLTLVSSLVSRLHAGVHRERRLARTDPLTGAANARTFYEEASVAVDRSRKAALPLTLAYFDVDNFKRLNDRLGHAAGDAALQHVVETIQNNLAGQGLLARLGGDEFALLLPDHAAEAVVALLARIQGLLTQEMVCKGWPVTLSVGAITFLRPAEDVDTMIRQVDALMYGAKKKGKGRVEHTVMKDEPLLRKEERRKTQRRNTVRIRCGRTARVRMEGQAHSREDLASVRDISAGGIGLSLEKQFPLEQVFVVESLAPGPRTLVVRVVRVTPDGARWLHGCVLSDRLNAEELSGWLGVESEASVIITDKVRG